MANFISINLTKKRNKMNLMFDTDMEQDYIFNKLIDEINEL